MISDLKLTQQSKETHSFFRYFSHVCFNYLGVFDAYNTIGPCYFVLLENSKDLYEGTCCSRFTSRLCYQTTSQTID